jgi:hypothetical protein
MTSAGTRWRRSRFRQTREAPRAARRHAALALLVAVSAVGGCTDIVAQYAQAAQSTAQHRAQFELDCPEVQTTILSQKTVQGIRWDLAEYTIGARGCGRQEIYLTYCRDESDCNAIAQSGRVQAAPAPGPGAP